MKKKLTLSLVAIMLSALLVGGYTMAWFTDSAASGAEEFTAGTVLIEAGSSVINSQNFSPDEATYLYGAQAGSGDLYEIDVKNLKANKIFDMPEDIMGDNYSPNGLGFDNANRRLYFAMVQSSKSKLYYYDFGQKQCVLAGELTGKVYGGTFGEGHYWSIANGTDDLYKVSFDANGKKTAVEVFADISDDKSFAFGDVAIDIRNGVIYGSSAYSGSNTEFFKYNTITGNFETITENSARDLQLAFGSDGILYGHRTTGGNWWTVDIETGGAAQFANLGGLQGFIFNDLASGYRSVWNPGDCEIMRYYVRNTGSKRINVRGKICGSWYENIDGQWKPWDPDDDKRVVSITLDGESANDWSRENDYFYYNGVVKAGNVVELGVKICLDGPNTDNQYQGKRFILKGSFEAIQASHDAGWNQPQVY